MYHCIFFFFLLWIHAQVLHQDDTGYIEIFFLVSENWNKRACVTRSSGKPPRLYLPYEIGLRQLGYHK